ncbi:MAG TPA: hypothetical protein VLZ31_06140 [Microbacteriaceae bacterium]|nr:hypothetical protein [Microbacteriaceae bacterium]
MIPTSRRVTGTVILTFGLVFGMAACSNPVEMLMNKGVESALGSAIGSDLSIDTGKGASLPEGWPDVPTPKTAPTYALKAEDGYTAGFLINKSEMNQIISDLETQGFGEESSVDLGDAKILYYDNGTYNVAIMMAPESDDEIMLSYTIIKASE